MDSDVTRRLLLSMLPVAVALSPMGCEPPMVKALDTDTHEFGPGKGFSRTKEFHMDGGRVIRITRDYGPGAQMDFVLTDPLMGDASLSMPLAEAKAFAETMLHLIHKRADQR
jgi:hypothetical protein